MMAETSGAPLLSVVTASLNTARFLRETLDSVARQTFKDFEHIVVDGGSTDGTQAILAEYPSIRWISEPDGPLGFTAAIKKAAGMARGKYVMQCCISDGFLDPRWFGMAVAYLEAHPDCALVWSFPQLMSQDGALLGIFNLELLERPPRDGTGYLPFWAASRLVFPEGNYCTHAAILRECFPSDRSPAHHHIEPHAGFTFNFMRRGYLSAVIPQVSSYFRRHGGQRQQELRSIELPAMGRYHKDAVSLWWAIVCGREPHIFRNPQGIPLGELSVTQRARLFVDTIVIRLSRLKILRYPPIHVLRQVVRIVSGKILSKPYDRTDWQRIP